MMVKVIDEYSPLKTVVVSSADYFNSTKVTINNETIRYYAEKKELPTKALILREQRRFWDVLKQHGVTLLVADQVDEAMGQMFTRDLAFVIGTFFFISSMKKENRRLAIQGWDSIIKQVPANQIIRIPTNLFLEGGDVVVAGKTVYVGISERTTMESVTFLQMVLGKEYIVIPLKLKPKFLHLDVVFTMIHPNLALVYKEGFEADSYQLLGSLEKIEVTKQEQFELATNVFVLDPKTIIINARHKRLEEKLKQLHFTVIPLDLTETAKAGGAFRCMTCPIERC